MNSDKTVTVRFEADQTNGDPAGAPCGSAPVLLVCFVAYGLIAIRRHRPPR